MTGTVSTAPENRNQPYYKIDFYTPSQASLEYEPESCDHSGNYQSA